MPIAPNIVLQKPLVLLSQSTSISGVQMQSQELLFGTIQLIYSTSDSFNAGDSVLFSPKEAIIFQYGSTIYFLIDEKFILFTETPLP